MSVSAKTIKITNLPSSTTEEELREFCSVAGTVEYVEVQSHGQHSKIGYVTFKDVGEAEAAINFMGSRINDSVVNIELAVDYKPPNSTSLPSPSVIDNGSGRGGETVSVLQRAEDVISSMLAKSYVLGRDAVSQAKSFDEKHQLTSTAVAKAISLDTRTGLTGKISTGTAIVSQTVRQVDQKFQVSDKTKSALAAAEQKVSIAGSAAMRSPAVSAGTAWLTGTLSKVSKAAVQVRQKAKEKAGLSLPHQAHRVEI